MRYPEIIAMPNFIDRYKALRTMQTVAEETFGYDRWFNQQFYTSVEWKRIRRYIIVRDNGCDLAIPDRPIAGKIIVHHIEPITLKDIQKLQTWNLLNPDNLICVSMSTHNAIHYGGLENLPEEPIERKPNDTIPWRK